MKRREFLHTGMMGSLAPLFLGGLNVSGMGKLSNVALEDEKVLIVIQLNGGNDGLNTVILKDQYSLYQKLRQNIAIPEQKLLSIPQSDKLGLHPSFSGIKELFETGKAALIQDVGYPDPDFSHFRSMDIWHSASDSNKHVNSGWVGRYLSLEHPDFPNNYPNEEVSDPLAVQIGSVMSTAVQGPVYPMGLTLQNPDYFYEIITNEAPSSPDSLAGKELNYLRQIATQTNSYSKVIKKAAEKSPAQVNYPDNYLGYQLKVAARLIGGGLKTKFYFVNIGGFDTHADQVDKSDTTKGSHANILLELSSAVKAFMADIERMGKADKVMAMTYSEFGRRIRSNSSTGTDHGAAAPMFLFGEKVNSRVFGQNAKLPSNPKEEDSLPMQYDFRSVYTSILENWFCVDNALSTEVMLKSVQSLPLIHGSACQLITSTQEIESEVYFKAFPNPVRSKVTFSFQSDGFLNQIQLFNTRGQSVGVLDEQAYPSGLQELSFDMASYSSGIYFARWQNKREQKVIKIIKL